MSYIHTGLHDAVRAEAHDLRSAIVRAAPPETKDEERDLDEIVDMAIAERDMSVLVRILRRHMNDA